MSKEAGETIRFVVGCMLAAFILYGFYALVTFSGKLQQ